MEIHCPSCKMRGETRRPEPWCPACGKAVLRRQHRSPGPLTHFGQVALAILSLRGLFLIGLFTVFSMFFRWWALLGYAGLFMAATRFSWRTMAFRRDEGIQFPELVDEDLWSFGKVLGALGYTALFLGGPLLLVWQAERSGHDAWLVLAGLLVLGAPMGLVLTLRAHSLFGVLDVPTGLRLVAHHPLSYLGLAVTFFAGIALPAAFDAAVARYTDPGAVRVLLAIPGSKAVFAFSVLWVFGLCGLYVREHARFLDVPCDDDDWAPVLQVMRPTEAPGPQRTPTPRQGLSPLPLPADRPDPFAGRPLGPPPGWGAGAFAPPQAGPPAGSVAVGRPQTLSEAFPPPAGAGPRFSQPAPGERPPLRQPTPVLGGPRPTATDPEALPVITGELL